MVMSQYFKKLVSTKNQTTLLPPLEEPKPAATTPDPAPSPIVEDASNPTLFVRQSRAGLDEIGTGRHALLDKANGDLYFVVPKRMTGTPFDPEKPRWRIELALDDPRRLPIRLEIADSASVGRGDTADVNMDAYDGAKHGISRQHAMLRPSKGGIYFFDLGSTNGSRHNGIDMGAGAARPLKLGDVIRLGSLSLTVRHLEQVN